VAERRKPRGSRAGPAVLILVAYPRRAQAERAARLLVRERVLACATTVPGARAFYHWRGREEAAPSTLLYGKTTAARSREAVRRIRESHPDEVPEILVLDIVGGHPGYLAWVAEEVRPR
jgi:periplasmic divalent cation tolerance protein